METILEQKVGFHPTFSFAFYNADNRVLSIGNEYLNNLFLLLQSLQYVSVIIHHSNLTSLIVKKSRDK